MRFARFTLSAIAFVCVVLFNPAQAGVITLQEFVLRDDGAFLVVKDISGFNTTTGLGVIKGTIQATGSPQSGGLFFYFDHEINQETNTFFNEYVTVAGLGGLGNGKDPNTWEADEPGFFEAPPGQELPAHFGDIFSNVQDGNLDNQNTLAVGLPFTPNDPALAVGWENLSLDGTQSASFAIYISEDGSVLPGSLFALTQHDNGGAHGGTLDTVTLSALIDVTGGPPPPPPPPPVIPEPCTSALVGLGLAALACGARWRARKGLRGGAER